MPLPTDNNTHAVIMAVESIDRYFCRDLIVLPCADVAQRNKPVIAGLLSSHGAVRLNLPFAIDDLGNTLNIRHCSPVNRIRQWPGLTSGVVHDHTVLGLAVLLISGCKGHGVCSRGHQSAVDFGIEVSRVHRSWIFRAERQSLLAAAIERIRQRAYADRIRDGPENVDPLLRHAVLSKVLDVAIPDINKGRERWRGLTRVSRGNRRGPIEKVIYQRSKGWCEGVDLTV